MKTVCFLKKEIAFFLLLFFLPISVYAFSDEEKENIRIYEEVSPSVVNIVNQTHSYDFYYNPTPDAGSGTGIILDIGGNILTNNHVISNAEFLEVTLNDGSSWKAFLVGNDPGTDLAVIKIDAPAKLLKPVRFGSAKNIKVGQKVLALGNPFGLERSLSIGIVSSLGRTMRAVDGRLIDGVIQTDAAINPGNSGGPLLDREGKMIGINSAMFSPDGANIGIGFAIPVETALKVLPQLMEIGYVSRLWIGINGYGIDEEIAKALGLPVDYGIFIVEMAGDGPAHKAGLKWSDKIEVIGNIEVPTGGDIITKVDGMEVKSMDDLHKILANKHKGDKVIVEYIRDKKTKTVEIPLEEMPRL